MLTVLFCISCFRIFFFFFFSFTTPARLWQIWLQQADGTQLEQINLSKICVLGKSSKTSVCVGVGGQDWFDLGKIHEGRLTGPPLLSAARVKPSFDSAQSQGSLELCSCSITNTNLLRWAGLLFAWASPPPPRPCRSPSPSLPLFVTVSLYDKAWPLRHSRRKHCACFHQSPLWQRQMVQSSTFTSIPAGMIVVPAKQFGPVALGREGGRERFGTGK